MPFDPVLMAAGGGVGGRSLVRALFGWKRYPGSVEAICRAVLEDCWRGDFFAGSAGHFRQFWTRDLAMCTPALCRLGMRDRPTAGTFHAVAYAQLRREIGRASCRARVCLVV